MAAFGDYVVGLLVYFIRAARTLAMTASLFLSSCSQIRSTLQPSEDRIRLTLRSRRLFALSFSIQNLRLFAGMLPHLGQQCQKQPSMKIATLSRLNAKSGRPVIARCRRQPVIPLFLRKDANKSSVSRFPRDLIFDITSERLEGVKTSGMESLFGASHHTATKESCVGIEIGNCASRSAGRLSASITRRAIAVATGTTTELPNCLYAWVSETGI